MIGLALRLAVHQRGRVGGQHRNLGYTRLSAYFVIRKSFLRVPSHVKSSHKLFNLEQTKHSGNVQFERKMKKL